jgi:hypothetical protein
MLVLVAARAAFSPGPSHQYSQPGAFPPAQSALLMIGQETQEERGSSSVPATAVPTNKVAGRIKNW